MVSLSTSSSLSSLHTPRSELSARNDVPSPARSVSSSVSSAASSSLSLSLNDQENVTITGNRLFVGKRRSQEDLRLLAVSTSITELSYGISDIQTRIFEIQELRHKSQPGDSSSTNRVIDQSLASLDERLDAVLKGVESVNQTLQPLIQASQKTPTLPHMGDPKKDGLSVEDETTLRKHAVMLTEWEAVQKESQVLREELKEDKWLTVFRTVTDQADGMMSSLEKAINRCQDFLYRVQKRSHEDYPSSTPTSLNGEKEKPLTFEVFMTLSESYEAKKKHYMPATTKVLSIIDKGVQDRVTKNGECLRRHAESTTRWKNLKDRIARTDAQMAEMMDRFLQQEHDGVKSEAESSTSGITNRSGKGTEGQYIELSTSGTLRKSQSKAPHTGTSMSISRSISPFRKLARKIKGAGSKSPVPQTPPLPKVDARTPSSEPIPKLRHRVSLFNMNMLTVSGSRGSAGGLPPTPDKEKMGHKYSHSLTPESTPSKAGRNSVNDNSTGPHIGTSISATGTVRSNRPAWNSSTRVEPDERTRTSKSRRPSVTSSSSPFHHQASEDSSISHVPVSYTPSYKRSASRASMTSSRPWSPVTSSISAASTAQSSLNQSLSSFYRPPSRAHTPGLGLGVSPRTRPKTPSHIPAPVKSHWRSMSASPSPAKAWDGDDDEELSSIMQRAFSPTSSTFAHRSHTPGGQPPRPPSRSMIPVPSVQVSGASRPGTSMSNYGRPESATSFRGSANTPRPSLVHQSLSQGAKVPPSSFKESVSSAPRTSLSRPPSRSGAGTPSHPLQSGQGPLHPYTPMSSKDPLDTALAAIANSMSHHLLIERLEPPLRRPPGDGEEVKAQYAFTMSVESGGIMGRKIVWCKLTTLGRGAGEKKKVMCRVGGGWQDLQMYIASRQAQAGL